MAEFKYRGIISNGKMVRGKTTGKTKHDITKKLKDGRIQPIIISPLKTHSHKMIAPRSKIDFKKLTNMAERAKIGKEKSNLKTGGKIGFSITGDINLSPGVKAKDVLVFTNNLYILKKAKFNNIAAFESLYNSTENKKLKDVVDEVLIGIESGHKIYEMMAQYPKIFPPLYVNFVKVGEESGSLDTALLYARDYMESSNKLKKQLKGILLPKVIQFILMSVAMIVALLFGVPLIENVYEMFGTKKELPAMTKMAVVISKWIIANWYTVTAVVASIILVFVLYIATSRGRYWWDRLKIKVPVFGRLNLNIITNKFFQAMLLNLKNGLRIQDSLEIAKNVTDNYYFLSLIETGKNNLLSGGSWVEPFAIEKAFSPMMIEMIETGMKTDLVEMMSKIEEYIKQEIDESIEKTIKALPDITYAMIGILLILFILTVMVPLIDVYMGGFLFDAI